MKKLISAVIVGIIVFLGVFMGSTFAQKGVINLDETVIKGRIQKPEAFYILQNANLNYEALEPKKTFIPELLESVEEDPF